MNRVLCGVTLIIAGITTVSCGSGPSRQLQSITINAKFVSGSQFQLVATGNFSSAPMTVTPLPVFWSLSPPPPNYSLTAQPFEIDCAAASPGPWIAMAPANPHAPASGSVSDTKMVTQSTGCVSVNQ